MKILSRDGFKNFSGWLDQGISKILKITFTDTKSIKVTPNHKFLLNDNETWIEAAELKIDDILYPNVIISKIDDSIEENVYDAFDVEDNNSYYTNGVISHNCSLLYIDECLVGDTKVTIRDKDTGKTYKMTMERIHRASSIDCLLEDFKANPKTFANGMKSGGFKAIATKTLGSYIEKYGNNYSEIFYNIENPNVKLPNCKQCNKTITTFISFKDGYRAYCSHNCSRADGDKTPETSKKIGAKKRSVTLNSIYADPIKGPEYRQKVSIGLKRFHKETPEAAEKISIRMKNAIASGVFTPNVTNSWTRWKTEINGKKLRSSFEGLFYLYYYVYKNDTDYEYEKLRIPYTFENNKHTYITDFVNHSNKTVIEIKPKSLVDNAKNIAKFNALTEWCKDNSYEFCIITESELKLLLNEMIDNNFEHEFINNFLEIYPWKI